jgi:hypothetical protein
VNAIQIFLLSLQGLMSSVSFTAPFPPIDPFVRFRLSAQVKDCLFLVKTCSNQIDASFNEMCEKDPALSLDQLELILTFIYY